MVSLPRDLVTVKARQRARTDRPLVDCTNEAWRGGGAGCGEAGRGARGEARRSTGKRCGIVLLWATWIQKEVTEGALKT